NIKLSKEEIDNIWNDKEIRNKYRLARIQIINNKVYADSYDIRDGMLLDFVLYFKKLVSRYKIKNTDILIHCLEGFYTEEKFPLPSFMVTKNLKNIGEKDRLLLPDATFIRENIWKDLTASILEANKNNPWDKKLDRIFWRGKTTGGDQAVYNINNIAKLPRLKVVLLSSLYPNLIDAKFTSYPRFYFEENSKLQEILKLMAQGKDQKVSQKDHLKYKYLLSIDGNSSAWERVPWIMISNSVLVKQESVNIQWFYPGLKPYYNYVPIDEKIENIFSQLEWMKANDQKLQEIVENANHFVANNLMPEHIDEYASLILNEYSKLFTTKDLKPSLPSTDNIVSRMNEERFNRMSTIEKIDMYLKKLENKLEQIF
ncbi:MAG: glycosyl transferase family 90, partial [Pseudomonadota bacterium]